MDKKSSAAGESMTSSSLNASAAEFIPRQAAYSVAADAFDKSELTYCVDVLRNSPEALFDVAYPLVERLSSFVVDDQTLNLIVDTLFQQCCSDSNFRYTGARLCSFLYNNLQEDVAQRFRASLLTRAKKEFNRKDDLAANSPSDLVNFTLFMGELMHNLRATINGEVIKIFPPCTADLLKCLLETRDTDNIKGFTQAMKLVGAILEKHEPAKTEQLFTLVKNILIDEVTPTRQRNMLLSLVELRSQKWLVDSSELSATENQLADLQLVGNTAEAGQNAGNTDVAAGDENLVVYSDEDEEQFENFNEKEFEIVYDGDTQYVVPREMDADMEDEYEKFVAENLSRLK